MALYVKLETTLDDIAVRPLFGEECRFGFPDMDECDRNSMRFHILTNDQVSKAIRLLLESEYVS